MSDVVLRVVIADDSPVARNLLKGILDADPQLEIVGEATNGSDAVKMVLRLKPDVVTMDLQMPQMDGLKATEEIMVAHPTPIVVVSSTITRGDVEKSMDAIFAGALAAICKPASPQSPDFVESARTLVETVKSMATVKVIRRVRRRERKTVEPLPPESLVRDDLLAIAASTGGPEALRSLLAELPADFPLPILVVQHISSGFTDGFVSWLQNSLSLAAKVAEDGERLTPGTIYMGPETHHLGVTNTRIRLTDSPPLGGFRPSATSLFQSVADAFGDRAIGVILTGMGEDGVQGLRSLHEAGGHVIAQDEKTSVVFGMPGAAIAAGVVDEVLPIDAIAGHLIQHVKRHAC